MKDFNTIISLLNLLGLGGVGFFLYYLHKGLTERISNLSQLAKEQQKTISAVNERALEVDKLSKHYKQALEDFQDMGSKLENRRKELVDELEDANRRKDEQLTKLKELELQEIELKEKSLNKIPELEKQLQATIEQLRSQIEIVTPEDTTDRFLRYWEKSHFSSEKIPQTELFITGRRGSGKTTLLNYIASKRIIESFNDETLNVVMKKYLQNEFSKKLDEGDEKNNDSDSKGDD